eukprot:COSAG05_NODE_255_length_12816_cov_13.781631_7_plen_80_part_00
MAGVERLLHALPVPAAAVGLARLALVLQLAAALTLEDAYALGRAALGAGYTLGPVCIAFAFRELGLLLLTGGNHSGGVW